MPFRDRADAGRQLARLAAPYAGDNTLVLGLPRGGVPVAFEVAAAIGAPLDVMVARKLGAPRHPEFAVGAIAPGGIRVIDDRSIRALGISRGELDEVVADETVEMERRLLAYRGSPLPPDVAGRVVILVDDGLATGATARAAIRALRAQGPERIVLAVPVCAPESAELLRAEADDVLCAEAPDDFRAVGLWYDDFRQTSDDEVLALLREARATAAAGETREIAIPHNDVFLRGDFTIPQEPRGIVIFAHGSGSGRKSPRNQRVAGALNENGFATLLLDLLTVEEERLDEWTRHLRFDIPLLARRLENACDWMTRQPEAQRLGIGLFGASTGAAAALICAAERSDVVQAVVSRGGRPDLAEDALPEVRAPTLLIVGGDDAVVIGMNEEARAHMTADAELRIIPHAGHLFEEPGALDQVAEMAADWFARTLAPPSTRRGEHRREAR